MLVGRTGVPCAMLVGATACALQVTASRHRDPPAAATRTHAPCQPSATSFTRGMRSRMPGVPFGARWRRTRGRAVEGEGAARPRRRRPGEASCDCEGSAARLVDAMAWARAVGGAAWLARRGVLVWGGVVEKGCRAADARRATSTAGLSSVSFLLQRHVTHHPLRLPLWRATRPLSKHASTRNTLSVHQSVKRVEGGSLLAVSVSVSDSEQDQPWGGSEGRENAGRIQRHRLRRPQVPGKQQHRCLLEPSRTASLNPIPPRRCCRRGASRTCARTPAPPPSSPGPSASRRRTRCVSCAALGTRRFSRIAIRVSFCQGKWREI